MATSTKVQTTSLYSQAAQQMAFPTREQAIVLDSVDGVSVQDYVKQISKIVDPINIRFVSRISNSRVCLYLNSKQIVDKLTETPTKINIGSNVLEIRPLISQHKRIILSNVCPIIPHDKISEELKKYNIEPKSPISFIRFGMNDQGFAHILSFRRQTYISPDDIDKLPASMKIHFEGTDYWIYLSTDKVMCFLCKEEGHVAKYCKNVENASKSTPQEESGTYNGEVRVTQENNISTALSPLQPTDPIHPDQTKDRYQQEFLLPTASTKRQLTTSLSSGSTQGNADKQTKTLVPTSHKNIVKKPRINDQPTYTLDEIKLQIQSAKDIIETNEMTHKFSFDKIAEFLHVTYNNKHIPKTVKEYTENISTLQDLLIDIQNNITDNNLKNRIKRIIKRIENSELNDSSSDTSSIKSQE